jgi:hypothetical protein
MDPYDPETKEQSKECRHSGSPRPKKFKTQTSSSKVMACVFWDKHGILLVNHLEKVEPSWQAFEKSLVSRQCCSAQGGHYAP